MHADGSHVTLLANTEGRATAPRWSPDGARVYFTNCVAVDMAHDCHIYFVDAPKE
jgi:TolB protein